MKTERVAKQLVGPTPTQVLYELVHAMVCGLPKIGTRNMPSPSIAAARVAVLPAVFWIDHCKPAHFAANPEGSKQSYLKLCAEMWDVVRAAGTPQFCEAITTCTCVECWEVGPRGGLVRRK